jgi:hypothetical protein
MKKLNSVSLFLDFENGDLYQVGEDGTSILSETVFNIFDRDGRSYDNELFDELLDEEDSKTVISFLFSYIQKEERKMKEGN